MKSPSIFARLVLGCIDSYDSNQIVIFAAFFEIYKILIFLHSPNLKISAKTVQIFDRMQMKFHFSFAFFDEFCNSSIFFLMKFCRKKRREKRMNSSKKREENEISFFIPHKKIDDLFSEILRAERCKTMKIL